MSNEPTPGPWRMSEIWRPGLGNHNPDADVNGNVFFGYSISGSTEGGGHILPTLAAVHNFPDNIEANARLIASAPDLKAENERLTALNAKLTEATTRCQKILAILIDPENKGSGIDNMVAWTNCVSAEKAARAALTKAGEPVT